MERTGSDGTSGRKENRKRSFLLPLSGDTEIRLSRTDVRISETGIRWDVDFRSSRAEQYDDLLLAGLYGRTEDMDRKCIYYIGEAKAGRREGGCRFRAESFRGTVHVYACFKSLHTNAYSDSVYLGSYEAWKGLQSLPTCTALPGGSSGTSAAGCIIAVAPGNGKKPAFPANGRTGFYPGSVLPERTSGSLNKRLRNNGPCR